MKDLLKGIGGFANQILGGLVIVWVGIGMWVNDEFGPEWTLLWFALPFFNLLAWQLINWHLRVKKLNIDADRDKPPAFSKIGGLAERFREVE